MYNPFFLELFTFRRFLLYIYYRMDTLSVKSEYKYSCAKCIDNTKMYVIIIKHMITFKDKKNNKSGKSKYKYSCECCHYNTSGKYHYNTHLLTLTTNILHL
jgi:hypothetical protein